MAAGAGFTTTATSTANFSATILKLGKISTPENRAAATERLASINARVAENFARGSPFLSSDAGADAADFCTDGLFRADRKRMETVPA